MSISTEKLYALSLDEYLKGRSQHAIDAMTIILATAQQPQPVRYLREMEAAWMEHSTTLHSGEALRETNTR